MKMNPPSKRMDELFNTEKFALKLLLFSTDNTQLSKLNKNFNSMSKKEALKASWILSRPKLLRQWTSTYTKICESSSMFSCFRDWLAYRYWPAHAEIKPVNKIMGNPLVITEILRYAVKTKNKDQIQLFWNVLASEGSLLGIAYLVDENLLKDTLCDQVSMVTHAFYSCMLQTSEISKQAAQHFMDLLLDCRPLKNTVEEYLFYSVMRNEEKSVANALVHCNTLDHLFHSLCQAKRMDVKIYNMVFNAMNADDQLTWSKFEAAFDEVDSDTQASFKIVNDYLARIYQESSQDKFHFSDYWLVFLEAAVRSKNIKSIQNLLDAERYEGVDLFVSFGIFSLAIELEDYTICDMLVPYIDLLLVEEIEPLERVKLVLNQLCQMRRRVFFKRIWPFHDFTRSEIDIKKKCEENQVKCIEYFVKTIERAVSTFVIDSPLIWQAFQEGNFAIAQKLQELGGIVQWMDSSSTQKIKKKLLSCGDLKYQVDVSQAGLFQAYGGKILETDSPNLANESSDFNEFAGPIETNGIDYSRTRRPSTSDFNSAFSNLVLLGARRESRKKENDEMHVRLAVCRQSSAAAHSSETHWTKYFKSAMEDKNFLRSSTNIKDNSDAEFNFEWMESSNEPALPLKSTEDIIPENSVFLQMVQLF
jgi:uncharacterized protein YifE (UPF0438 family)